MLTAQTTQRTARLARRGFTLVEIVVAVGILAIVGVVIGTIFASVGDTVSQGRQVSNLNRFVARVERVMRRDFDSMVRDNGFMVIRNETTSLYNGAQPTRLPVGLTVTDSSPRPRRIDEIMFFSRQGFTSRRTPLHPDMIAKGDVARIYYGHGQKMPEDFGTTPGTLDFTTPYARPRVDEPNNRFTGNRLGQPSSLGVVNPNEFASNWSLLRHVTALVPRQPGLQTLPNEVLGLSPNEIEADYNRVADSSRQVALGPAAQSVFRAIAHLPPYEIFPRPDSINLIEINPTGRNIRPVNGMAALVGGADGPADGSLARPLFMSGIVDVAVTDLAEIRRIVTRTYNFANTGLEFNPSTVMQYDYTSDSDRFGYEAGVLNATQAGVPLVATAIAQPSVIGTVFEDGFTPLPQTQQQWMLDALPSVAYDPVYPNLTGFRMRYEDVPPRVYVESGAGPATPEERRQFAIEQADQEMLSSSVFVPRCTEFIVEWSFGIVDRRTGRTYGQQIWHGLRRTAADGMGTVIVDSFSDEFAGMPLVDRSDRQDDDFSIRSALPAAVFEDGNQPTNPSASTGIEGGIDQEIIELIRMNRAGGSFGNPADEVIAEYLFGYVYQDWNDDEDGDTYTAGDADDVERPWPWPKMIRVTMRFVDPADLEDEQTFQFEFRVPSLEGGR